MLTVGIDPGHRSCGAAVLRGRRLIRIAMVPTVPELIAGFLQELPLVDQRCMVIEDQYLARNPATMKKLVAARASWTQAGAVLGFKIQAVAPSSWQYGMLKVRGQLRRAQLKRLAEQVFWGTGRWTREEILAAANGEEIVQDMIDAALLAVWYVEATEFGQRR